VPSEVEELAHTRSAKKMIHVIREERIRNRAIKSAVKTYIDKAEELISGKEPEPAKEAVQKASIALDKAARKGVIHPNNAARHKSRLMKKLNVAFPPTKAN
jgi:small subunit ribosomal protein S20